MDGSQEGRLSKIDEGEPLVEFLASLEVDQKGSVIGIDRKIGGEASDVAYRDFLSALATGENLSSDDDEDHDEDNDEDEDEDDLEWQENESDEEDDGDNENENEDEDDDDDDDD